MSDKRVTYLIGAGASANALPVVNKIDDRMKIFLRYALQYKESKNVSNLFKLILEHSTVDTLAKKLFLKQDLYNYNLLKELLTSFFLFEQSKKDDIVINNYIKNMFERDEFVKENIDDSDIKDKRKQYNDLCRSISNRIDYRYDSFFATLLEGISSNLNLPSNINVVSWNYDNQMELAYSEYLIERKTLFPIQAFLNIYPSAHKFDRDKSAIIKLNGTATYLDHADEKYHDPVLGYIDAEAKKRFLKLNDDSTRYGTNIKFAWEDDGEVKKAREYASQIISESDVIVIIGYSFPTFNREVDRQIFDKFNKSCYVDTFKTIINKDRIPEKIDFRKVQKKIYIQDLPQNVYKIKERLKAVGDKLFDVAEIYDEVDQFFIPPEL